MTETDIGILWVPLLAGALVLLTHVPLGQRVLARGIVFIDLAIAQLADLGAIVAGAAGFDQIFATQISAGFFAVSGGLLLTYTERRWPQQQEALIGVLFVLAASVAMLLLSNNPHADERFREILAGQILWMSYADLGTLALGTAVLAAVAIVLRDRLTGGVFYLLFALTITVSVQYIGISLVFASLIIPALVSVRMGRENMLSAYLVGLSGYVGGLLLSLYTDLPAAPLIVCCMAAIALGVAIALGPAPAMLPSRHNQLDARDR